MNLSLSELHLLASNRDAVRDDAITDWLGGEAWVNAQPLGIECVRAIEAPRDGDPANDWVPL